MKVELTEAQWLHEQSEISIEELAELSGLSPALLRELVDYGALVPINTEAPINPETPISPAPSTDAPGSASGPMSQWNFAAECVVAVRTARRLRDDFDLDPNALSVALMLVERIHELEAQLRQLHSQFPNLRMKR
jgi:chaperone modulatory protein CbpM